MASETGGCVTAGADATAGPAFVLARDFGERVAEINNLYNGYTGRARSLQEYEWEWRAGPEGPGVVWTITERATGRLVGHHGIVRTPMVRRGTRFVGGRTENTIVEPSVRRKLFYVAMEKRALTEALQTFDVVYTVFASGAHAKVRARLGYAPVGRWVAYLPRCCGAHLVEVLRKARERLGLSVPDLILRLAGLAAAALLTAGRFGRALEIEAIDDVGAFRDEYEKFWNEARRAYALTIDRSFDFLRWWIIDNPYVAYRVWALRRAGRLEGVVIGHRQTIGNAWALEIDDIIVRTYDEDAFARAIDSLRRLEPTADAVVVRTLAVDTPLYRVLRRRLPLQAAVMRRWGQRFFEDLVAYDRAGASGNEPWYVTPVFMGLAAPLRGRLSQRAGSSWPPSLA